MSIDHPTIIPECYVDTNLIGYLVHGTVNHQHSCNKVVGTLTDKFSDRFAVGIIDKDKVEVGYLRRCTQIAASEHLGIWKHNDLPHFLITMSPAVDKFILDCAREQNVKTETFGLPSQLKDFLMRTKTITSGKDPNLRRLIEAIRDNREMVALNGVLQYLINQTYQASSESISAFFER